MLNGSINKTSNIDTFDKTSFVEKVCRYDRSSIKTSQSKEC